MKPGTCYRMAEQLWGLSKQQKTPKSPQPLSSPRKAMLCPVANTFPLMSCPPKFL